MSSVARDVIWPTDAEVLVRVVFLHVGQGDSTVVLAAEGETYKCMLIDTNVDGKNGGVDVPRLMEDLLDGESLRAFVNTHPHNDHLRGLSELDEKVEIKEVWHSGHKPGKAHDDSYKTLKRVIDKVKSAGGREVVLKGSRSPLQFGEAECYVLAPAAYVTDDIEGEKPEARYQRIHEQCAVLRLGKDDTWVMVPGDADRDAWEKHITDYHKKRLPAAVLGAAHHGSRSFFRHDEEEDPYEDALEAIGPTYVIISAPTSEESEHDHPHQDAVEIYEEHVGRDNVLHTGEKRHSFICDVFRDGSYHIFSDNGELAEEYATEEEDDRERGSAPPKAAPAIVATRVDRRPMGSL